MIDKHKQDTHIGKKRLNLDPLAHPPPHTHTHNKEKHPQNFSFPHFQTRRQSSQAPVTPTLGSVAMELSELFSVLDRPGPQDKVGGERERERRAAHRLTLCSLTGLILSEQARPE